MEYEDQSEAEKEFLKKVDELERGDDGLGSNAEASEEVHHEADDDAGGSEPEAGADDDGASGEGDADAAGDDDQEADGSEGRRDQKAEKSDDSTVNRQVPYGALKEERDKRKRLEEQMRQMQADVQQTRGQAAEPATQEAEEDWPDALMEPEEWNRRYRSELAKRDKRMDEMQASHQQERHQAQLKEHVNQAESNFRARTPDYDDGVKYLFDARRRELESLNYGPEAIQQQISQDATGIMQSAIQQGVNPAEAAYNIARQRGYAPQGKEGGAVNGEASKMTAREKAASATRTAGGGGGGETGGGHTLKQLAGMSAAELAKVPDETKRKLMGG